METDEQKRFDSQYRRHLRALKLQGKSDSTIDVYARAVRRIAQHFDCYPDRLSTEQLEEYFAELVESHTWSTVKVDRNGLQFFWKHVLRLDWSWVKIIKPPKIHSLPDILTMAEIERMIGATRKLRYRVFLLTTYSMGLRLRKKWGHHLADPDQWHSIFPVLAAKPRFLSAARRRDRTKNASSVFFVDGNGFLPDPHQSPFWIQALGLLPQGSRHPAPGSYEPQKTLGSLTLSKCFRSLLIQAARRAAPTTRLRNHRSMAGGTYPTPTPRWLRTEAHQS